jgi:hypothetical protein
MAALPSADFRRGRRDAIWLLVVIVTGGRGPSMTAGGRIAFFGFFPAIRTKT